MYRLKMNSPEFTVTDGPLAGMTYRRNRTYTTIPPANSNWFEEIEAKAAPAPPAAPFGPAEDPEHSAEVHNE